MMVMTAKVDMKKTLLILAAVAALILALILGAMPLPALAAKDNISLTTNSLATIVVIQLVALFNFGAEGVFLVAVCLGHFNGFGHGFSFSFAVVKELFVSFVVVKDFFEFVL